MTNMIKCRFCDWQTPKFTTKKGKRIHGYNRLVEHVAINHWAQFCGVMTLLEDNEEASLPQDYNKQ